MDAEQLAVNTIKALSMDAVQAANSGHPGMPMGMADLAVVLWTKFLKVDPTDPAWADRDRFVLSNGHGSMLLYSLLNLAGFPLSMEDIANFRQWGYPTAGHPERHQSLGIEMTTGPLGQGVGTSVGIAMAEAHLRRLLGSDLVDHRTWVFCSDGDLMEGVSAEAASLAGHLALDKLTWVYDDNEISIGGDTDVTFTEDVGARFAAMGWHVIDVDGHDRAAIEDAYRAAIAEESRPTLIQAHTHIAHGAPTAQDTAEAHGNPLGPEEIARTKEAMGWTLPPFEVPDEVRSLFAEAMERNIDAHEAWEQRRSDAFAADAELAKKWDEFFEPGDIGLEPLEVAVGDRSATRAWSGKVIDRLAQQMPNLLGGSADLEPSTKTYIEASHDFQAGAYEGRNARYGVREHVMGTAVNGMTVHGGMRAFSATFLVFSDYQRPAVRLSALMEAPSIWVYTHDSVFLGEDGPTHQPIEHLASLRAMPDLHVIRPADATETVAAWEMAINRHDGPTALVFTRQSVPELDATTSEGAKRGGYVVRDGDDAVLVATGSELWAALEAAELLAHRGMSLRVVSLPCWETFFEQDETYRSEVLGTGLPRVSLEAGATFGWERIVGSDGLMIGVDHFGASAPAEVLAEQYGLTPEAVADQISAWMA